MKKFTELQKLKPGDQVAVVSPSAGLPGLFPWIFELGLQRMTEQFGLRTKEYPTTRQMQSGLEDRARDLHAAFSDKGNKAVIASIGGSDQIKLLKHLEPEVFTENPKPFFGYSDNTHFINYLWNLGIPAFYGGSVMNQYGFHDAIPSLTEKYLRHALFTGGEIELTSSEQYNDIGLDWSVEENMSKKRVFEANDGWHWDGQQNASGTLWGGCVESMIVQCSTGKYLPNDADLEETVLFLETAEDIPEHWIIEYLLTGMGERGWFEHFQAVLVGRPKAWEFNKQNNAEQKVIYRATQRETVIKTVRQYNASIPIVQNLDFGHTDPQIVLPVGRQVRLDSKSKKIFAQY